MDKISEYTIVTCKSPNELIAEVNRKITEGWTPIGGVVVITGPMKTTNLGVAQETWSSQTMVR